MYMTVSYKQNGYSISTLLLELWYPKTIVMMYVFRSSFPNSIHFWFTKSDTLNIIFSVVTFCLVLLSSIPILNWKWSKFSPES